jgi:hypothetical protein
MSHDVHEALRARLQDKAAGTLPSEEATRLLEHAAECEECARLLAEHPAHAEALLDAAHADAAVDPEVEDLIAASTVETSLSRARFAPTLDPYCFSNSASNGIDLRIFEAVAQDRADPNPSIQILLGRIYKLAKIDFDQLGRFVQLRVFEWRRCVRASEESCSE